MKMGIFSLTIELGNDAMQTLGDVRRALIDVATTLTDRQTSTQPDRGRIGDENGNTVGTWRYVP